MAPQKVIIDTDPGVDDAMAIVFACLHPDIDLVGLTTIFGNVTTDIATRNALAIAELAKVSVPVARGADKPIVQPAKEVAWEVHGREGLGDVAPMIPRETAVRQSAAEFICETVSKAPGEIVLCPVGPLTNLALALELDPSIAGKVKSVTVMGGSLAAGGNVTQYAEANIWQDPHAANKVFSAEWNVNMVGLDVTHQVTCSPEEFAGFTQSAPVLGGFLNEVAQYYFDFHLKENGFRGCYMHDPTAVIAILRPDLFEVDVQPLEVILDGDRLGQTVVSNEDGRTPVNVYTAVDASAVCDLFIETVRSGF